MVTFLPPQKSDDPLERSRVLDEKQMPAFEEFELSIGDLSLHRLLIAYLSDPIVATATNENGHPQSWQPIVSIMALARCDLSTSANCTRPT